MKQNTLIKNKKKGKYNILISFIGTLLKEARKDVYIKVNQILTNTYWQIGKKIVEFEQKGKEKADYGSKLLERLSRDLKTKYGKGFSIDNLERMRKFYLIYKRQNIRDSVADFPFKLSWSHYCELIKIKDKTKRTYFEKYTAQEGLSVRSLKRQIYTLHYERLLMSKDKKELITFENKKLVPQEPKDLIKDPYILEFLELDEKHIYTENQLESRILDDLQKFLLELGQGFSFVARQKRFTIDNDHFYIDLLFYNIYLKCYVVIELKIGKFKHQDVGQMNFYINYIKKELNKSRDNDPVGIVLCTEKDKVQVEFALAGISNRLFISKYKLYLPSKKELEKEIKKLL